MTRKWVSAPILLEFVINGMCRKYAVCMAGSSRMCAIKSAFRSFFAKNKKVIICSCVIFVLGIVVGAVSAWRAVGGEFEEVLPKDAETGGARVFFFSTLALIGCYALVLLSGINEKTVFLAIIPIFLAGFFLGRYSAALIGRFGALGVANLIFAYIPFFLCTFVCLSLSTVAVMSTDCAKTALTSNLKLSFVDTLKLFGINVLIGFVLFVLIGSIYGVIIVSVY